MIPHKALDALTPPARMSVAAALKHQGPARSMYTDLIKEKYTPVLTHTDTCHHSIGCGLSKTSAKK